MNRTLSSPSPEAFGTDPWKTRIDRTFARALVLPLVLAIGLLVLLQAQVALPYLVPLLAWLTPDYGKAPSSTP
jgi:hypothetical protein